MRSHNIVHWLSTFDRAPWIDRALAMAERRTRAVLPTWWGHSTSADYAERVWTAEESCDPVLGIFLLYSTLCIIPSQGTWWHLVSLLLNSLRFLLGSRALGISLYTAPLEQWFQALSWEEAHQGRGSWQAVRLYRAERPRYPAPSVPLDRPRSWCQIRREVIFFLPSLRALLDHGIYLARSFRYWGGHLLAARRHCGAGGGRGGQGHPRGGGHGGGGGAALKGQLMWIFEEEKGEADRGIHVG